MAHSFCPSGHDMWNGDGTPIIWAFRIGFFHEFIKEHPNCVLSKNEEYWQLYDCVREVPGEDLDCWYCDECQGLVVYIDNIRYDFTRIECLPQIGISDIAGWEEYIAMRDWDFEKFMDHCTGMNPLQAIETYTFQYKYYLSPDKKIICAFDANGEIQFGYQQLSCIVLPSDH